MNRLLEILRYVDVALFVGLAWITFKQWHRHRDAASRSAFLMFAALGGAAFIDLVLPVGSEDPVIELIETLVVALVLLFPYFLYRLARSFSARPRSSVDILATTLTAAVVIWAGVVPRFPDPGEPRPTSYQIFVLAALVQWVLLSVIVAVDFWRSGTAQPDVARYRLRTLSLASVLLSVAIVISGTVGGGRQVAIDLAVQAVVLLSVIAFFIAFSPPRWLRVMWRSRAEGELRQAAIELMSATDQTEVIDTVLPQAAHLVGGQAILLLDQERRVLGSYGFSEEETAAALDEAEQIPELISLEFPFGFLLVRTSPHTPFFGADDITLLGSLGALMSLALKRLEVVAMERQLADAKSRRRQALEINDNIVQGLAVAHYAFELGQHEKGLESVKRTLDAARRIIGDLVRELPVEEQFGAQTLTRSEGAFPPQPPTASPVRQAGPARDR
jgi:hypothetical protein